uniref:Uncharacterized protein n=1 Tax=Guillardia theta TaxID=55529 RepID=A0A7S4H8K7_GUITH|mmetsp:Transcript_10487/g.35044  ORF Transcript_10487/g.35044 Transcript_10487/m.35044 type:complete len:477 (+) Transcript_10487:74-1504(+)
MRRAGGDEKVDRTRLLLLTSVVVLVTLSLLVDPRQDVRVELENKNPQLRAAQKELQDSSKRVQSSLKILEEVEDDVPNWMTELPAGLVHDALRGLTSAGGNRSSRAKQEKDPRERSSGSRSLRRRARNEGAEEERKKQAKLRLHKLKQRRDAHHRILASAALAPAPAPPSLSSRTPPAPPSLSSRTPPAPSSPPGLTSADRLLLGRLFGFNTVLHKLSTVKHKTYNLALHDAGTHQEDEGAAVNSVVSQADMRRSKRVTDSPELLKKLRDRRRQQDQRQAQLKSEQQLEQAARHLLDKVDTSRDPWLRSILSRIATDTAKTEVAKEKISRMRSDLKVPKREQGLRSDKQEPAIMILDPHDAQQRRRVEAQRLLQHLLSSTHDDLNRMRAARSSRSLRLLNHYSPLFHNPRSSHTRLSEEGRGRHLHGLDSDEGKGRVDQDGGEGSREDGGGSEQRGSGSWFGELGRDLVQYVKNVV